MSFGPGIGVYSQRLYPGGGMTRVPEPPLTRRAVTFFSGDLMDINEQLMAELAGSAPRAGMVRSLIAAGADANQVDAHGESLLMWMIGRVPIGVSFDVVRALVEGGADVNYEDDDGWRALCGACFAGRADVVRLLLEHGASACFVMEEDPESLMDLADFDEYYEAKLAPESEHSRRMVEAYGEIIPMLKAAGAKRAKEMAAARPRKWVHMTPWDPTGLVTGDGHLAVRNVPDAGGDFVAQFERWRAERFDPYPLDKGYSVPAGFDREMHNATGLALARELKGLLGEKIAVKYYWIDAEAERVGERSVEKTTIG